MDSFDTATYLSYSLSLKMSERKIRDFYSAWLPPRIIDVHAHNNLPEHVEHIEDRFGRHMMSTFPYFTLEQSQATQKVLFPGREIRCVRFSHVINGTDFRAANEYLLQHANAEDLVALLGLPDDPEYTIRMIKHPRVKALKMYYLYFDPPAQRIYSYFLPEILEAAQEKEIPIILHLPKLITLCIEDLLQLLQDFPRLKVVLAHLGLPHLPVPGLLGAYKAVAEHPNVYLDTAMVPSAEVVAMALSAFGPTRIMFGSDEPLHLIRSTVYENPILGQRLVTEYLYHWVDAAEHAQFKHLASGSTHSIWQALEAIRLGIESMIPMAQVESVKQMIFHDNARRFFEF